MLRGVAAIAVIVHHFYNAKDPSSWARSGAAGVDLFFVISGFIMVTVARNVTAAQFMTDRFWRIFPLWFISVLPWLLALHHDAGTLLTTATLWPVWGEFYSPANPVGWSLCFEMMFYGVFALGLATRRSAAFVIFFAAIGLAMVIPNVAAIRFIGSPLSLEFLMGVCIAALPRFRWSGGALILLGMSLFAIAPATYADAIMGPLAFWRVTLWGVPAAMLVYGFLCFEQSFTRQLLALPVLVGDASYSIYLFHKLFILLPVTWLLSAPLAIAGCLWIHFRVERPIVRRRTKAVSFSGTQRGRMMQRTNSRIAM